MAAKTIESFAMTYYQPGAIFYSHKQDKDITAIANYYNRKIKTERMVALDSNHTRIESLTKITFL